MGKKNKDTFKYYYNLAIDNKENSCGLGSDVELVKSIGTIDFINTILKKYQIKSVSDCPCGLFENWMYLVGLADIKYIGYDINDLIIERNKKTYDKFDFVEFDLTNEVLPNADLIICRDCLFHLSDAFVMKAIENFKNSNSSYLLATTHDWLEINTDLTEKEIEVEAGYRFINLRLSPFNLGPHIETHIEAIQEVPFGIVSPYRNLSLWKL